MSTRYFACTMVLFAISLVCIGAAFPALFDTASQTANTIFEVGTALLWLASILALGSLYKTGGFRHSRPGRLFKLVIACYAVYAVARIQHWSWAGAIAPIPFLGTIGLYGIWFLQKPARGPADFLKLAWVLVQCASAWFLITGQTSDIAQVLPLGSVLLVFAAYVTTYSARRSAARERRQ